MNDASRVSLDRGVKLLHDPVRNKSTAFTEEERASYGLRGLLPPRVQSQDIQVQRAFENLRRKNSDLERYIFLSALQDRNEALFYRLVSENLTTLMPIVYTPTVGEACQKFGHIFRRPRGLFISANDKGSVREVLRNWPHRDVRIIVVTDGERILGLGDLGADGMGIPIGKLILYTACAGIDPTHCLPVTIDVGTDNAALLKDPLYIGLQRRRIRGAEYDELIDEFIKAVREEFPRAVIQLEDFANTNAFRLLEKYRDSACLFDDDIQGTGSVVLSGLMSSSRISGLDLEDQRFLFLGAGEAGIGIATMIVAALVDKGVDEVEARKRCWFVDSKGLVVSGRTDVQPHKIPFAQEAPFVKSLLEAVNQIKPTALIGVSGIPRTFSREIIARMAEVQDRPIIFALSNPTSKSECTARQAYEWTEGKAIFASGSPFDPVSYDRRTFVPGQANNAYIFPGVGLGAIASQSRAITDRMFFIAAKVLSEEVSDDDLRLGRVFPPFDQIRDVSARIATAVSEEAYLTGLAQRERPSDIHAEVVQSMFDPRY